jgi:hypothetical protein
LCRSVPGPARHRAAGLYLPRAVRERGDKAVRAQSIRGRMAMLGLYVRQGAPWLAPAIPLVTSPSLVQEYGKCAGHIGSYE